MSIADWAPATTVSLAFWRVALALEAAVSALVDAVGGAEVDKVKGSLLGALKLVCGFVV